MGRDEDSDGDHESVGQDSGRSVPLSCSRSSLRAGKMAPINADSVDWNRAVRLSRRRFRGLLNSWIDCFKLNPFRQRLFIFPSLHREMIRLSCSSGDVLDSQVDQSWRG